ncbi:hypothetical protein HID58_016850, partial [Brassica napus]
MGLSPIRKITAQSHINNREKSLESGRYPEETDAQRNLRRRRRMIYRKWSLLSGPPVILGGAVVAAIAVGIVLQNGSKRRTFHQTNEIMDNEKKTLHYT